MKIADMHCDTVSLMLEKRRTGIEHRLIQNSGHLDLMRMKKSGYILQNFALFVDLKKCHDPWEEMCALYDCYLNEMSENSDMISPVLRYNDIENNASQGKMSSFLTVEEGAVCMGEMEKLKMLYDMGVRMMTLTWNYPNVLGFPAQNYLAKTPDNTNGLSVKGREMVEHMEKLGMIIDVSHLSDAGFCDILDCTKKPFVASHSNSRAVCGCARNLTDDMLKKLADRGGCTGLNFHPPFLAESENSDMIDAVVKHAKHIVNCAGIDALALGSDFDGIDDNAYLKGAESMSILWDALCKSGFSEGQIDKIFYKNVLRVYRDVLK